MAAKPLQSFEIRKLLLFIHIYYNTAVIFWQEWAPVVAKFNVEDVFRTQLKLAVGFLYYSFIPLPSDSLICMPYTYVTFSNFYY